MPAGQPGTVTVTSLDLDHHLGLKHLVLTLTSSHLVLTFNKYLDHFCPFPLHYDDMDLDRIHGHH